MDSLEWILLDGAPQGCIPLDGSPYMDMLGWIPWMDAVGWMSLDGPPEVDPTLEVPPLMDPP